MALLEHTQLSGRIINSRYRIEALIGKGGTSNVYLTLDLKAQQLVATKILHPSLSGDPLVLKRFLNEIKATCQLRHPNILRPIDFGLDNGDPYLVTELMRGGTLKNIIESGHRLDESQTVFFMVQALRGLEHSHKKNTVHRDIKPANLLFDEGCGLVVGDFGLAKAMAELNVTEPVGQFFGSFKYASPEQAMGLDPDPKSDIYSISLCAYEAMVGKLPFYRETPLATLRARIDYKIEPSSDMGILGELIALGCSIKPEDRPSATELRQGYEKAARKLLKPKKLPLVILDSIGIQNEDDTYVGSNNVERISDTCSQKDVKQLQTRLEEMKKVGITDAPRERNKPKRATFYVAIILAILLAMGGSSYYFYQTYLVKTSVVPSLVGRTEHDASIALYAQNLKFKVIKQQYSSKYTKGVVMSQYPSANTKMRPKSIVNLTISLGPFPVTIPDTIGKSASEAVQIINKLGFRSTQMTQYSETVSKGIVISQSPSSGQLQPGNTIKLFVSEGPAPRTVPNLSNLTLSAAESSLESLGLTYNVVQQYSNTVAAGNIISSNPSQGSSVSKGSNVTIYESLGPQMTTIPNVASIPLAQCTSELSAAGIQVSATYGPVGPSAVCEYTYPPAGNSVVKGSSVILYTR